jgi:hypothetical protein
MSIVRRTRVTSVQSITIDNVDESLALSCDNRSQEIQTDKKERRPSDHTDVNEVLPKRKSCASANSSLTTDKLCRICFEAETVTSELISPCKCSGSIKWVHEECLKTWILGNRDELQGSSCELCSYEYKMNLEVKSELNYKEACKSSLVKFLFTPLLGAVLLMLALIIYLLIVKYEDPDSTQEEKSYSIGIAVACSLAFAVISYMILRWFLQSCVRNIIKSWRILNYEGNNEAQSEDRKHTRNEINDTTTIHPEEVLGRVPDTSVMIIPSEVRVNGRTVISPSISPPFLTPVNRNGATVAYRNNFFSSPFSSAEYSVRIQQPVPQWRNEHLNSVQSPDCSLNLARILVPGRTPTLAQV